MRALFTFLLNSLSTAHATFQSHANITPLENQLKQLHLEISNSLEQKHSIARCAKQLNISESYFQLIYKKEKAKKLSLFYIFDECRYKRSDQRLQ